jgi:hypothetical protein
MCHIGQFLQSAERVCETHVPDLRSGGRSGFASVGTWGLRVGSRQRAPRTAAEFARRPVVGFGLHSMRGTPPRRTSFVVIPAGAALQRSLDARVRTVS